MMTLQRLENRVDELEEQYESVLRGFPDNDPVSHRLGHENMMKMTGTDVKDAFKEGLREWLDDKFADFGKWSLMGILAAGIGVLAYVGLIMNGWHR